MRWFSYLLLPLLLQASLIPQSGYSGRPGDGTCRACHPAKDEDIVAQDSSVILGLPDSLVPDRVYACTLEIRYRGLDIWSFELTTVDSNSSQAGFVRRVDTLHTLIDTLDGILYFKNSLRGAYIGKPNSARWAFEYVAPPAGTGPVSFYWCAYMANRKTRWKYYLLENCLTVPQVSGIDD